MATKPVLAGSLPQEIGGLIRDAAGAPVPDYRCRQICQWINRGAGSFMEMKNLPAALREDLDRNFRIFSSAVSGEVSDSSGTIKVRMELEDNNVIEAVILGDSRDRKTACISTQAGCPLSCVFCKTGTLGFVRNLTAAEMAEQFLFLRRRDQEISHIVVMGMGEPLLNLIELRKTIGFFTNKDGMGISKKRITVSTAGITEGIIDLADNGPDLRLAVSLTSARQDLREKLMPIAKTNPLPDLKKSLLYYQKKNGRRITLEAVLLGGINTGSEDADAMAEFAGSLEAAINLIPWNPVEGLEFDGMPLRSPTAKETSLFAAALEKRGLKVTLRMGKGTDISGACGQLGYLE
ncbi:MAG: 23S rRNA (adenine(2503)-C(2))-methyltransferase RlmN, partial [Treponema sp.]|nr:23S rRNA (adenine(2503)-C(2))-methyltransferase RlmN [Treponema sp.]